MKAMTNDEFVDFCNEYDLYVDWVSDYEVNLMTWENHGLLGYALKNSRGIAIRQGDFHDDLVARLLYVQSYDHFAHEFKRAMQHLAIQL